MSSAPGMRPLPTGVSTWNVANALTFLRVLLVPVLAWLLLQDGGTNTAARVGAFATFALAMLTDSLDGEIARRHGLVTAVGAVADPIADKAVTGTAFIGLSVLGEVPWWVTVVVLVREIGVTALRFVVIRHAVIPASRGGKAKTALQGLTLGLFILPLPPVVDPILWILLGVTVGVTVATGVDYVVRAVRVWRAPRSTPPGAPGTPS